MMKTFLAVLIFSLALGCAKKPGKEDLHYLNGYWEIDKVVFPKGDVKTYDLNRTVDYLSLEGNQGYRKKVQPKLDGSFITSNDAEPFVILEDNGKLIMSYKNALSQWREQIEALSSDNFTVVNDENIRYYYKRFQPLNIP
ncbi:MAG: lipocalin family protein [Flavobacteriaceae bacterium]